MHPLRSLLIGLALVLAVGCGPLARRHRLLRIGTRAEVRYTDEVTGRRFHRRSNPARVEVVRFAAFTSRHPLYAVRGSASTHSTVSEHSLKEALGVLPPKEAAGLRLAAVGREAQVPVPVVGTHPVWEVSRGTPPAWVVGGVGPMHFAGWREVLAAEVRNRLAQAVGRRGVGQLIQWPGGVHEIISDRTSASVLARESLAPTKTPIVILDFLTRFKQRPDIVIVKSANRRRALAGETVLFTIEFSNEGPVPAHNVLIADLVDPECDYVVGSARSSLPAVFSLGRTAEKQPILVWRLKEPLQPHQAGTITYRLRVRREWRRR